MTNHKILKIVIGAQIVMLVLVILGVSDSYKLLRWDILMVMGALALISISSRRYYFGVSSIAFALLFNPIQTIHLSKTNWTHVDIILVVFLFYWSLDYFHRYRKGLQFERFIQNRFPKEEWNMKTHSKDLHKKFNRFIESDSDPDLVFRKKSDNKIIAIECKYRSEYWKHNQWGEGISWDKEQGDRYTNYSSKNNTPVYVAVGVGGNPKSPKIVSYIPLELIQKQYFKFIPKPIIEKYINVLPS